MASEVRELESSVEEKVEARVKAAMRSEVQDAQKLVRIEMRDYIGRMDVIACVRDRDCVYVFVYVLEWNGMECYDYYSDFCYVLFLFFKLSHTLMMIFKTNNCPGQL